MNRIEPIGSNRVRQIVPVERVNLRRREDEDRGQEEQRRQQQPVRAERPVSEDDDLPHVDVVV